MEPAVVAAKETHRYAGTAVWTLLALIVALRLAAAFFLPFGQKVTHRLEGLNDEPAHFRYVQYLALHHAFPVLEHTIREPDAFTRNEFEYFQSPLYYTACAPLYALLGGNGALGACRILSVFFGLASLWVIALILRDCGLHRRVQLAAVLFTGLLPSHLYFSSVVSNDALSWLLALLVTRALLRYGRNGSGGAPDRRAAAAVAVFLALGALTKGSLLIFFPAAAAVFLYKFIASRNTAHLKSGSLAIAAAGIAVVPWYVRNVLLYHSLLGTPSAAGEAFFTAQGIYAFVKMTVKYFWFPMQHLEGGTAAFFVLCAAGSAVIAAHAFAALWYYMKEGRRGFAATALLLLFLLNAAAYVWYYFFAEWGRNAEARFLFPALGSIAFFFIVPAYGFFARLKSERFFLPYILLVSLFPYPFLFFAG